MIPSFGTQPSMRDQYRAPIIVKGNGNHLMSFEFVGEAPQWSTQTLAGEVGSVRSEATVVPLQQFLGTHTRSPEGCSHDTLINVQLLLCVICMECRVSAMTMAQYVLSLLWSSMRLAVHVSRGYCCSSRTYSFQSALSLFNSASDALGFVAGCLTYYGGCVWGISSFLRL